MITSMTARFARDNFTDLLGLVYYGKNAVKVEKKGRVFAVVVNPEEYQLLKKAMQLKFAEFVEEIQKMNKKAKISQVMKDVTAAVEEVRARNYAKNS